MAPTSSSSEEPAPVKAHVHVTHQFWKRHQLLHKQQKQLLLHHHHQRLKPAVIWGWPAAAAAATVGDDVADDDDGLGGAWPPRSYTCAFCCREFRSAQALGGHMNVHRRDRAKLRGGGHHGAAAAAQAQLGGAAAAPATDEGTTKYAVLYPILNSNAAGAVLIPGGDVLLSAPVALGPAAHEQCHVSDEEEEEDKDVDLELRLWWP